MLKKRLFGLTVLVVGMTLAFTLVGCGDNGDPSSPPGGDGPFTVEFVANGGVTDTGGTITTANQTIVKGGSAAEPSPMSYNHEDFKGWYTSSTFTGSPYNFSTPVNTDLKLYAKWGYKVGDTGPAGGKVFYVKSGAVHPNWKYLEASPALISGIFRWSWGYFWDGAIDESAHEYIVEGAKGTGIGTGRTNTDAILAVLSYEPPHIETPAATVPAASAAVAYTSNGYTDWFLPSKDELNALYQSGIIPPTQTGGFDIYYWSSSQHDDPGRNQCAWAQSFGTGDPGMQTEENKNPDRYFEPLSNYGIYVRPIRSFFCSH